MQYLILHLPERPFLGLVGEVSSPPINFITAFCSSWNLPISGIFLRCVVQHLGLLGKYWGLRSVLEASSFGCMCPTFLEEDPKLLAKLMFIFARSGFSFFQFSWSSLLLSLGCCPSDRFSLAVFLRALVPWSTWVTGSPGFLEGLIWDCRWFPRNSSPCILFS